MPIPDNVEAPSWISSGAVITGGLDLLGLRLPVQVIGNALLNGITTVTPSVRYIALRAWLIHQYGQSGNPDTWKAFMDFSGRVEAALVLGNLVQDPSIGGLIGSDDGLERLRTSTSTLAISPLVQAPAASIYSGPSDQLGISKSRDDAVPGLTVERGLALAAVVGRRLSQVPILKVLLSQPSIAEVSADDLRELGAAARIDQIPDDEREILVSAIVPNQPRSNEYARVGTYASLLTLAANLKRRPSEGDLFDTACSMARFGEPILDRTADGWTAYCVRDSIAVTHEAVMAAVMGEIRASPDGGLAGVVREQIVESLLERIWEHDAALRDLALIDDKESMADLSYRELYSRIQALVSPGANQTSGIARWPNALTERRVYRRAMTSGAGALSLAAVAWILAGIRVGNAVQENIEAYRTLSYQGWRRLGLRDVILPELERFHRENRSLREVAAELAHRTVHQHLQITWSRLQVDLRRDVALLTAEGTKWFSRGKGFGGGRTASRLDRALGWLVQLKLIDDGGISSDGDQVLRRALKVLAEGLPA